MFSAYLTTLDVSSFDTSNVTDMSGMFSGTTNLVALNVDNFNTSKVERMAFMFSDATSFGGIGFIQF
ncbi:MAG: BspA family leucine-rich repeat surface protein [Bdellovibrionota bacterium]